MKPRLAARKDARNLALHVLLACREHKAFVQDLLDARFRELQPSTADRRLATQLACGVVRRRATLDALLRSCVARPPRQVEPWLWEILRLGAYQLAFLSQVPPHAAVHETVEQVSACGRPRAKGFVNGVLRSLLQMLTPQPAPGPAADALPVEAGQYRRLARPVLPDPETHPVEYLASAFSLPRWLAARWTQRYGPDECYRLGFWFGGPAPLWVRINPLRTSREAFLAALVARGITAEPGPHPQSVRLAEHAAIRDLPGYEDGWFTVQDETAMHAATALAPRPGMQVLDLCAAPGGKTTHLAELMGNQGRLVACDVDTGRLARVAEQCQRLGVTMVETCWLNADRQEQPPPGPFDAVLVDVPCSNTGVLGRRPEARWRIRPQDMQELVVLQTKLLLQAAERVRPGGAVVYSTCSIEPEENQGVVQTALKGVKHLVLEAEQARAPGQPADGGYWARLLRRS